MNKNLQQHGNTVSESRYPEARLRRVNNSGMNPSQKWLQHESLIVYQMALKFHVGAMTLLPKRGYPNLRDQLERASLSIVLNIAEGAGRKSGPDRRKFFTIAHGSLLESAALLEVIRHRGIAEATRCRNGRLYLIRLSAMLSSLAAPPR
jgi:four helix bundle protein